MKTLIIASLTPLGLLGTVTAEAALVGEWKDATSNYNTSTGTWSDSSGNSNNLTLASSFFTVINSTTSTAVTGGLFNGIDVTGLDFGETNTILSSTNSLTDLSNMTVVAVLSYEGANDTTTRLAGVGSSAFDGNADLLNPTSDATIRLNNGFTAGAQGAQTHYFIRVTTLSGNGVNTATINDYYYTSETSGVVNRAVNINNLPFGDSNDNGSNHVVTPSGTFYIGDIASDGSVGLVAYAALYDTALDATAADAAAQLAYNTVIPEPGSLALLGLGGLFMCQRRRR